MPKLLLLLLSLVFISVLGSQWLPVDGVQTSSADLAYLRSFAAATGADNALGWHVGSDPCEDHWPGLHCYDGKATNIDVQGKQLLGTVPDTENGSLSSLQVLNLGDNRFTGKLPLLDLPQLYILRVDNNDFRNMPDKFFSGMPMLQYINITNNTALAEWGFSTVDMRSLPALFSFHANNAGLNGTLHQLFSNTTAGFPFPSLARISMADNQLSGTMPVLKGTAIRQLDISNNRLSGSIIFITDLASSANRLQLSHNAFTGSLPDFSEFTQLSVLSVDHNQITGIVPSSLPRLEDIKSVYLSGNLLQGPVPEFNISVHTDVAKASATGSFCRLDRGPCAPEVESLLLIAGAFGYPHSLAASWMRNDPCAGWIGVHCDDRRRVTGIDLSRLGLSGTMDSAFGSLRSLEAIDLSGNNITGEIPASVAQLPSLRVIDVSNNNLVGTMPKFRHNVAVWTEGNPGLKQSGSSVYALNSVGLSALCLLCLLFSSI
ncbi:hypothetical protein QYE76_062667 [Lolium multiflorum]|uniref:Leucine-rich repeat-containing N-terminal plant-type domain-containing protein n=1 Tax=Lolium multiflorum TaxID=4521 RepID=A0AAD8S629_LOLMU|nr:hypothetical protein QYE76_062667 [Lolium multiflorum]